MTEEAAKAKLASMSMKDLLTLYNSLVSKKIKRFSSRAAGEKRVLELLAKKEAAAPTTTRTVNKMAGKLGRPVTDFKVALGEGGTKIRKASLRGNVIDAVKAEGTPSVAVSKLEAKFGRPLRGVIQKLIEVNWLKRDAA